MTITTQTPAGAAMQAGGTCRYPGCANPARGKDPAAPGPRPGYCEQEVPGEHQDGTPALVRHTALSAFRRRQQLAGQPGADRPVTAAVSRAAAIRDDALTAMTRLGAQLAAAIGQLAVLGEQLAAAGDLEAGEAQAEAIRAEAAAQTGQARAEAAAAACARHAAELDAAEARQAAAQAITDMQTQALARQHAETAAREAAQIMHGEREAAAARTAQADAALAAARTERDAALDAAARQREQDQHRHDAAAATATAQLAAANDTITMLRDQLGRAEAALDRERAEQHRLATHLHDLLTSGQPLPATAPAGRTRAGSNPPAPKETR
jgi:colicin import membrane protein